jgi:hypothetical protein
LSEQTVLRRSERQRRCGAQVRLVQRRSLELQPRRHVEREHGEVAGELDVIRREAARRPHLRVAEEGVDHSSGSAMTERLSACI